jgi:hypothetical protein
LYCQVSITTRLGYSGLSVLPGSGTIPAHAAVCLTRYENSCVRDTLNARSNIASLEQVSKTPSGRPVSRADALADHFGGAQRSTIVCDNVDDPDLARHLHFLKAIFVQSLAHLVVGPSANSV